MEHGERESVCVCAWVFVLAHEEIQTKFTGISYKMTALRQQKTQQQVGGTVRPFRDRGQATKKTKPQQQNKQDKQNKRKEKKDGSWSTGG